MLRTRLSVLAALSLVPSLIFVLNVGTAEAAKPRCTIVGTNRADVLKGTPGRDVICGRGGADRILGKGGRDVIRAGRGADTVIDGKGVDRVFGGPGADRLISAAVDNLGSPKGQSDVLRGGRGDDWLQGGYTDKLFGGLGDDDLKGYVLTGGQGIDYCVHWDDDIALCENDFTPPEFLSVTLSASLLTLTEEGASLSIGSRLVDDLGVVSVTPLLSIADPDGGPDLVFSTPRVFGVDEGTVRNGYWFSEVHLPAGSPTGEYRLQLLAVGRGLVDEPRVWTGSVTVTNAG